MTSTELHDKYIDKGGTASHSSKSINEIKEHMEDE